MHRAVTPTLDSRKPAESTRVACGATSRAFIYLSVRRSGVLRVRISWCSPTLQPNLAPGQRTRPWSSRRGLTNLGQKRRFFDVMRPWSMGLGIEFLGWTRSSTTWCKIRSPKLGARCRAWKHPRLLPRGFPPSSSERPTRCSGAGGSPPALGYAAPSPSISTASFPHRHPRMLAPSSWQSTESWKPYLHPRELPFILRRVEGMPLDDIARTLGTSLATVKRRIADAEHRLTDETPNMRGDP